MIELGHTGDTLMLALIAGGLFASSIYVLARTLIEVKKAELKAFRLHNELLNQVCGELQRLNFELLTGEQK